MRRQCCNGPLHSLFGSFILKNIYRVPDKQATKLNAVEAEEMIQNL